MHEDWGTVQAAEPPRLIDYHRKKDANRGLSCIQSDLWYRLGRTHSARQPINILCDEGGWVKIDDFLTMDILWRHESRRIDNPLIVIVYSYSLRAIIQCDKAQQCEDQTPVLGRRGYGLTEW